MPAPTLPIYLEAVIVPIIALVVTSVINGVKSDDPHWYRLLVAFFSIFSLTSGIYIGVIGILTQVELIDLMDILFFSITSTMLLTLTVTTRKLVRNLETRKEKISYILTSLASIIALLIIAKIF